MSNQYIKILKNAIKKINLNEIAKDPTQGSQGSISMPVEEGEMEIPTEDPSYKSPEDKSIPVGPVQNMIPENPGVWRPRPFVPPSMEERANELESYNNKYSGMGEYQRKIGERPQNPLRKRTPTTRPTYTHLKDEDRYQPEDPTDILKTTEQLKSWREKNMSGYWETENEKDRQKKEWHDGEELIRYNNWLATIPKNEKGEPTYTPDEWNSIQLGIEQAERIDREEREKYPQLTTQIEKRNASDKRWAELQNSKPKDIPAGWTENRIRGTIFMKTPTDDELLGTGRVIDPKDISPADLEKLRSETPPVWPDTDEEIFIEFPDEPEWFPPLAPDKKMSRKTKIRRIHRRHSGHDFEPFSKKPGVNTSSSNIHESTLKEDILSSESKLKGFRLYLKERNSQIPPGRQYPEPIDADSLTPVGVYSDELGMIIPKPGGVGTKVSGLDTSTSTTPEAQQPGISNFRFDSVSNEWTPEFRVDREPPDRESPESKSFTTQTTTTRHSPTEELRRAQDEAKREANAAADELVAEKKKADEARRQADRKRREDKRKEIGERGGPQKSNGAALDRSRTPTELNAQYEEGGLPDRIGMGIDARDGLPSDMRWRMQALDDAYRSGSPLSPMDQVRAAAAQHNYDLFDQGYTTHFNPATGSHTLMQLGGRRGGCVGRGCAGGEVPQEKQLSPEERIQKEVNRRAARDRVERAAAEWRDFRNQLVPGDPEERTRGQIMDDNLQAERDAANTVGTYLDIPPLPHNASIDDKRAHSRALRQLEQARRRAIEALRYGETYTPEPVWKNPEYSGSRGRPLRFEPVLPEGIDYYLEKLNTKYNLIKEEVVNPRNKGTMTRSEISRRDRTATKVKAKAIKGKDTEENARYRLATYITLQGRGNSEGKAKGKSIKKKSKRRIK